MTQPRPLAGRPGWPAVVGPVQVRAGLVGLRPLRRRDGKDWREMRIRDERFIAPWDASSEHGWPERHSRAMWAGHRSVLRMAARRGEAAPFAVTVDEQFAGQITLGGIQRGALQSGWIGYWVDSSRHGRGVATVGVALALSHAFGPMGLHRVEATIAPTNTPSRAVVGHLGFRQEGVLHRYLDVGGSWTDHLLFALTAEEWEGRLPGVLAGQASSTG
ncbi:GNAT family N-acetyltransferase [Nakamurella sp. YIM 132087]|uniref:GNAT family N-acetyltransferase n=1 Tax=Nakamurella alba TaxID=2665158 RepID=A0A7K1FGH8_9ACTN|nr:GNAT family protein [Nakamurella alba]MTD12589.1 GNAT family N-acetyltransferase [Nakamurella alba]